MTHLCGYTLENWTIYFGSITVQAVHSERTVYPYSICNHTTKYIRIHITEWELTIVAK
jgi:hypothetical protein